jgi:hypothetical protein
MVSDPRFSFRYGCHMVSLDLGKREKRKEENFRSFFLNAGYV